MFIYFAVIYFSCICLFVQKIFIEIHLFLPKVNKMLQFSCYKISLTNIFGFALTISTLFIYLFQVMIEMLHVHKISKRFCQQLAARKAPQLVDVDSDKNKQGNIYFYISIYLKFYIFLFFKQETLKFSVLQFGLKSYFCVFSRTMSEQYCLNSFLKLSGLKIFMLFMLFFAVITHVEMWNTRSVTHKLTANWPVTTC